MLLNKQASRGQREKTTMTHGRGWGEERQRLRKKRMRKKETVRNNEWNKIEERFGVSQPFGRFPIVGSQGQHSLNLLTSWSPDRGSVCLGSLA